MDAIWMPAKAVTLRRLRRHRWPRPRRLLLPRPPTGSASSGWLRRRGRRLSRSRSERRPARDTPSPPAAVWRPSLATLTAARAATGRPLDSGPCPPSAPRAAPATSCRPSAPRFAAWSASPPTSPARYGYRPIETPLFEQAAVFERGVGEVTDVVEKELFRLAPRTEEGETWALRPEPTAGIVRAYVQHGMQTLAAAGEAHADRADVPLRPAAGRPLPPVLAVRRRGDRRPGAGGRRRA